jgi:SAM-dependent methyltransferase
VNETTKARQYWGPVEREATSGNGIDIGCGPDPVTPTARRFDIEDGDANVITNHVKEQFDFVYSSHCLEHMRDARAAIQEWWKLVKPGGYLFILVPDEDLYEQGVFPSRYNSDHKATFTIAKAQSWSPISQNVLQLAQSLANGQIVSLELQDRLYDRSMLSFGQNKPDYFVRGVAKLTRLLGGANAPSVRRLLTWFYPVDQTMVRNAQAQIQLIVKKAP